jgi:hypothetical protein
MLSRGREGAALAGNHGPITAVLLGLDQRSFGFGQPPESQQRPGSAEGRIAESRSLGQDELVLAERGGGIVSNECDSGKTDAVLERVGIGHKAGTVRMFRIVRRPKTETDHAEGMPDAGVSGRPPERLFETRARELVLAPGRRA